MAIQHGIVYEVEEERCEYEGEREKGRGGEGGRISGGERRGRWRKGERGSRKREDYGVSFVSNFNL